MSPPTLRQALRFATVSGSGAIVNLATFSLLRDFYVPSLISGAFAFVVACQHNFILHTRITFPTASSEARRFSLSFFVLSLGTLGVNLAVLSAVQHAGAPALVAQAAGIAAGFPFNFIGSRAWVFESRNEFATEMRKPPRSEATSQAGITEPRARVKRRQLLRRRLGKDCARVR